MDGSDRFLTRNQAAVALTEAGYPVRPKSLAQFASDGRGPPYRLFGNRAMYRWSDCVAWAEARMTDGKETVPCR